MLTRMFLVVALCGLANPTAAQFAPAGAVQDGAAIVEFPGVAGPEITATTCTSSRARKFTCGGASAVLGLSVGIPSARILIEGLGASTPDDDVFGIGSSAGTAVILVSGSLVVLGGLLTYVGVKLLIDAFRPPTKYAFRPVAGPDGPGLSIRIRLP